MAFIFKKKNTMNAIKEEFPSLYENQNANRVRNGMEF